MREINRVGVLGSGVMGGAIAAHCANCGIPSIMLDIVPPNLPEAERGNPAKRNAIAEASKTAMLKAKPSPLYSKSVLDLIEVGNFEDDMAKVAECDWIIEVVKEDLTIKKKVYAQVAKHRKPGTIVTSNTSGIPIASMLDVMDADMQRHFLGTHFFNPPRYLKLVEIIPHPATDPDVVRFMAGFMEDVLGKGVVYAKDSPNFIANRVLTFASQFILHEMTKDGLSVEEVDALTGPAVGHASSATFRTYDLVGLDTYVHVLGNVADNCPNDERLDLMVAPDWLTRMVEKGLLGQKSGSGFYKATDQRDEKGKRVILGLDLNTLEYRDPIKPRFDCTGKVRNAGSLEEKMKIMYTGEDKGSVFAWKLFANTAIYAGNRIPEIADDIVNIDNAVKWGFAWDVGIFEAWDILDVKYVCDRMREEGLSLPPIAQALLDSGNKSFYTERNGVRHYFDVASQEYRPVATSPNLIVLADTKSAGKIVAGNEGCSLVDLGDGILCAEFHTKMNSLDVDIGQMLTEALRLLNEGAFEGMVIANQGEHFCAGANIFVILGEAMQENWKAIDGALRTFQQINEAIRFCKRPIVCAPHHYTLGGGTEMCMHTAKAVVAGETYGGLVEVGVGLIPGGGGCKEMLRRALAYVPDTVVDADPFPYVRRAFENIAMAKVSTSGAEYIELGYLTEDNPVIASFDQQVKRAKDLCRGLITAGYRPPKPATLMALGEAARAAFRVALYSFRLGGYASEHDAVIAEKIAHILTGGERLPGTKMTEQDVLDLEREAFLSLVGMEKTQQRIQHMLTTGKPLRN
ncbi:MAG: 3-hydroxyacyl-CoA dehydrogenase/enoyl-CoA hydratase family protein [Candidatus Hydrogenedentes bacterium]|nr:3-hydroxyacyl-CoA dehydrogenase/enoyl-CoA hydratase family protein [Candidatus Hydrogenedentota bacterium]